MEYVVGLFLLGVAVSAFIAVVEVADEAIYRDNKRTAKTLRIKRKF